MPGKSISVLRGGRLPPWRVCLAWSIGMVCAGRCGNSRAKFHIDCERWHPEDCQHREIVLSQSVLSRVIKRRSWKCLREILPSPGMTTARASRFCLHLGLDSRMAPPKRRREHQRHSSTKFEISKNSISPCLVSLRHRVPTMGGWYRLHCLPPP
jgi:hypothetical protein